MRTYKRPSIPTSCNKAFHVSNANISYLTFDIFDYVNTTEYNTGS